MGHGAGQHRHTLCLDVMLDYYVTLAPTRSVLAQARQEKESEQAN